MPKLSEIGPVVTLTEDDLLLISQKDTDGNFVSLATTVSQVAEVISPLLRKKVIPKSVKPIPVMAAAPTLTNNKATGVSGATIVNGGSGYAVGNNLIPDGGVFDTAATIRVTAVDADGKITAAAVQKPGVYTTNITGQATVTGGDGTGATFNLSWNAAIASSIYNGVTWARTDTSLFEYTGYQIKDSVPGYRGNGVGNGTQCVVEFYTDAPRLDIRLIGGNAKYDIYVDGQRISDKSIDTDSSGAPFICSIDWNGVAVPRQYRILGINTGFGGIITERSYSVWAPTGNRPALAWQLGDSYTFGTMASQASFNNFKIACDALGIDGIADGIGGSGWTSSTESTIPQNRVRDKLGSITRTPDYIFLSLGYNDAAAGRIEVLKTNFTASVELARQLCPKAKIIVIGPATPVGATTQLDAIRTGVMELCTQLSLDFVDIRNWVNGNNKGLYTAPDQVHPNDAGYYYRGGRMAQALSQFL